MLTPSAFPAPETSAIYNDFDAFCCDWTRNLIADRLITAGTVDGRSIAELAASDLAAFRRVHLFSGIAVWDLALADAHWPANREVWTVSCPCPPFSQAGKKQRCPQCENRNLIWCPRRTGFAICSDCKHAWFADARHLWPEAWRLVAERRPQCVFGEQVASSDGLEWLAGVQASMEILGYAFGRSDYPAAGCGAPHIRQRIFWAAYAECDTGDAGWFADKSAEGFGEASARACAELGRRSVSGRLADADGRITGDSGVQRSWEHRQQPQDGGVDFGLVQPDSDGCSTRGASGAAVGFRGATDAAGGPVAWLGDTASDGWRQECSQSAGGVERGIAQEWPERSWDDSIVVPTTSRLANPRRSSDERGGGPDQSHEPLGPLETATWQRQWGGTDPWHRSIAIPCADGKLRRVPATETGIVEPALFPLAAAGTVRNRVATLRGAGNSINYKAASRFIQAFLEAERDLRDAAA